MADDTALAARRHGGPGALRPDARPDPADSRAKLLRVTERGRGLVERAVAKVERTDAAFFTAAPDRASLIATLRSLVDGDRP
ncbi:hypothetical protein [Nonomuraea sp. NPDC005501]|uniref:hypothetical protein n=1 Tax=Nonomuraea sp. NPDC005501 TaxID=3156884 RepID=UPI0033B7FEE3